MRTRGKNPLIKENLRLKSRNKLLAREVVQLMSELELAERNLPLQLWSFLESVQNGYSRLMNTPVVLKINWQDNYGAHPIKPGNLVAIKSTGKYKRFLLNQHIYDIEIPKNQLFDTKHESSWEELIQKIDPSGIRLLEVNRSWWINVEHFNLKQDYLSPTASLSKAGLGSLLNIKLKNEKKSEFQRMKKTIRDMNSFQNISIRSLIKAYMENAPDI